MPTVLVVDDDESVREAARVVLEDEGYTVDEAPDGASALDMLRVAEDPMVVLLDIRMPHLSGIDVLTLIGGDARLTRHSFVIWAASRVPLPAEVLTTLAVPVVPKPFNLDELLAGVAKAAERLEREESA
jgi:CheY-like chemotaxis protein